MKAKLNDQNHKTEKTKEVTAINMTDKFETQCLDNLKAGKATD